MINDSSSEQRSEPRLENVQEMKIRASSSLRKNHHRDTLLTSDFALKIPAELEAASQLRIAQYFVTQMPWLDLYGVHFLPDELLSEMANAVRNHYATSQLHFQLSSLVPYQLQRATNQRNRLS